MQRLTIKVLALSMLIVGLFLVFVVVKYQIHPTEGKPGPSASVQIAKVQLRPMVKTLTTYGVVNVAPERIHQLSMQSEALVQRIFVTVGQRVKKDEPLLQTSPSASAHLNLENAKINVDFATKELNRLTTLRAQYLATNAEVEAAKQNLAKAEAELFSLNKQQQNAAEQILKAAEDSIIVSVNAQPGQVIAAGTPILTYADYSQVQIRLGVESEDLHELQVGQKVMITPIQNQNVVFSGLVEYITGQLDPTTGLINVVVLVKNASTLILGSMVRGEISLQPQTQVLAVPRSAILYGKGQAYVFMNNKGKAERRFVTLGEDDGKFVAITKGVKLNEQVVIAGNYVLQNGMTLHVERH